MDTENSVLHEDPNRPMTLQLEETALRGAITGNVLLSLDEKSRWTATADSTVVLNGDLSTDQVDALPNVTITAVGGEARTVKLASGGTLVVKTGN